MSTNGQYPSNLDTGRGSTGEVIPENGELRLSARGRRLQGVLDNLEDWAKANRPRS